jgi:hypothetical protein
MQPINLSRTQPKYIHDRFCKIILLNFKYLNGTFKSYMNKKHWNTVMLDGSVPDKEVFSWIDHSYDLIAGKHKIL